MEIGLTGAPLIESLPGGKPAPLYHLLQRLNRTEQQTSSPHLAAVLDCLEFLERYFAGYAAGLLRKLDNPAELDALIRSTSEGNGVRRLLRFSFERLSRYNQERTVEELMSCFFLHGKRSLPIRHSRWLGLAGGEEPLLASLPDDTSFSYPALLESLSVGCDEAELRDVVHKLCEVLRHWLEHAHDFFERHNHYARLDERGWQCTLQAGDIYVELIPPLPSRLIPVEAQAPSVAPQTEDEHLLGEALPDELELDAPSTEPLDTAAPEQRVAPPSETVAATDPVVPPDVSSAIVTHHRESAEVDSDSITIWSAAELKSFQSSLRQLYSELDEDRVPDIFFQRVSRFISSVASGYLLLEGGQGKGKTLLAHAFAQHLADLSLEVTPLLFSVKNQFYPDPHTFLEQLNEHLRVRPGQGQRAFEALDSQVIKDLNRRTTADARSSRFSAYLSELRLVNGTRLVLILDGLDEGSQGPGGSDNLFSYLPATLPEGVYLIVTYDPERFRPGDREMIEDIKSGPSLELLLTHHDSSYRDLMERFLNRSHESPLSESLQETLLEASGGSLAAAQHMLDGLRCKLFESTDDLPEPNRLYERLFDRLYERVPDRYLDLFLLLATSDEPVSGRELSNLGIPRTDVLELLHSLPSLFHCQFDGGASLNLAHRAIRLHLQRTFLTSYAQSCRRLAGRALRRFSDAELAILPVRDELDRLSESVRRLLRWSIDSQDPQLLAEVCRHPLVNKLRRRIFSALEERALYHRKTLLLDTFLSALKELVDVEREGEFREELAWSLSSRALSYYHLGHYHRALIDIETAIAQFQILVDEQKQENLRNGLAAAFNRRSEIFRALRLWERALPDAERAVVNYRKVVDAGRSDLAPLLMLSLHNRGIIYRHIDRFGDAESDLEEALNGYLKLVERDNRRELRPQLAAVYRSVAALALVRNSLDRALTSATRALDLYETLVHRENFEHLRNELAAIYNDRGSILSRTLAMEEAERDYASAIAIRTYLVAEGRIDIRTDLATTYANRGLCLVHLDENREARESFDRSVEIFDRLVEEERREDLYAQRAFALCCRGRLHRVDGRLEEAREDYSAASGDYRLAVVSQGGEFLEELASALNSLAEISLQVGSSSEARKHSERVLEIYERQLSPERRQLLARERAVAHHNLAEVLNREGEVERAAREFQKAIDLITDLIENQGRPELTHELATSLLRFASASRQSPETRLRLVSRALAFLKGEGDRSDSLVQALTLRALIFRELNSPGAALDDTTKVLQMLENRLEEQPTVALEVVEVRCQRAQLFATLEDFEASEWDLKKGLTLLDSLEHSLPEFEVEYLRCRLLTEQLQLLSRAAEIDYSRVIVIARELDRRLTRLRHLGLTQQREERMRASVQRGFQLLWQSVLPQKTSLSLEEQEERLRGAFELIESLNPSNLTFFEDGGSEPSRRSRILARRGKLHLAAGRYREALDDFELASSGPALPDAETHPDLLEFFADVEAGRGAALRALGLKEEALEAYDRATDYFRLRPESRLSPKRAKSLEQRAQLRSDLQHHEEALTDVDDALEIAQSHNSHDAILKLWEFKAQLLCRLSRPREGRELLAEAIALAQDWPSFEAPRELPLHLGLYRLGEGPKERAAHLMRVFELFRTLLRREPERWREEAVKLFQELPLPEDIAESLPLEAASLETLAILLEVMPPGHTPLIERLLRRATLLEAMTSQPRAFGRLATGYMCLATGFCLLEYEKYGSQSLPRLVRCYLLVGRALVQHDTPTQLLGIGRGLTRIAQEIALEPPTGELEVEVNNLARLWLSLPPSKAVKAGVSRATLQSLRRW